MERENKFSEVSSFIKAVYRPIKDGEFRNEFQKDRDKILYSKSFRRLAGKTQVFLATKDDHVRNRLTHTLEVAQIAKTISEALGLDVNLTEAIALGHDLGHTPFGHVGERALNDIMNGCYPVRVEDEDVDGKCKGFKHNLQGIRVLKNLERFDEEEFNISKYTLFGIMDHSKRKYNECNKFYSGKCHLINKIKDCRYSGKTSVRYYDDFICDLEGSWSFEAFVVGISDEIAQRNHDIIDAVEFNILEFEDIEKKLRMVFEKYLRDVNFNISKNWSKELKLRKLSSYVVDILISDIINNSKKQILEFISSYEILNNQDFTNRKDRFIKYNNGKAVKEIISFSTDVRLIDKELQKFLRNAVLNSYIAQRMDGVGKFVVRRLFKAYIENPQQLPNKTIRSFYINYDNSTNIKSYEITNGELRNKLEKEYFKKITSDSNFRWCLKRTICDYIAGMTDKYALEEYKKLYGIEI